MRGNVLHHEFPIASFWFPILLLPVPAHRLVEDDIARDVDGARRWLIDPVFLRPWFVPNEHHWGASVVELAKEGAHRLDVGNAL
jgi:hypothetical protein